MKHLSVGAVAARLGVSETRVHALINQERFSGAYKSGSMWIIPPEVVDRVEQELEENRKIYGDNRLDERKEEHE